MNPYYSLLNQALARYITAIEHGDQAAAEAHRKIYLAIWPLAFADALEVMPITNH